ncbi:hypothetical protein [Salinibaculum rarum]|uniref:hypothetical protein n=1 Tax=Salinibaculum rarum TaxID=3058903 RepID=UPI00265F1367|nr:hypothetical protein [Salinibaculum sp. KK48]
MSELDDVIYGQDWTRNRLNDLADNWELTDTSRTDDEITLVFTHDTTDAICRITGEPNSVGLSHSLRLKVNGSDDIRAEADWAGDIIESATGIMQAYHAGVQNST